MFGRRQTTNQTGFSLIELMIVLGVMGVILTLSAPSMMDTLRRNRLHMAADNFYADLMLARSEAVKRNQAVVLCKSSTGSACASSGNWDQGWMIFADQDEDGVQDVGEPILRIGEAMENGDTLRVTGVAFANQLTYRNDGSSSGAAGDETFVFCGADASLTAAREIVVTITGRPKRQQKTTGSCPV
ncbi:MAG: GspH/FimT family pseudopilin [Halioglobus sp.]